MVRRRSTVRFRNGAPAQRNNSNLSNRLWEPFREPIRPGSRPGSSHGTPRHSSSHTEPRGASGCRRSAELCGLVGSVMDLLDCAEDHRRGALDGSAHEVPWAVAVVYLGEPLLDRHGRSVRAGGHVAARQHAGQDVRCRVELVAQDAGESAFAASMMAQEWWATRRQSMASACWVSRRYRAPSSWCRPVIARPGA